MISNILGEIYQSTDVKIIEKIKNNKNLYKIF